MSNKIIHDQAAEFLSEVLQESVASVGLDQLPTSGGHPQTDGLVKQFDHALKQRLDKVVIKKGCDWDKQLRAALLAYRAAPHSTTGMSPLIIFTSCMVKTLSYLQLWISECPQEDI